jgi:hypothetical protein
VTIHYAREEVPEVLKFTPATATLGSAAAETDAAQAAMRPLAGFGAGAFTCDGAPAGSGASELAASLALPRIRGGVAATSPARAQAHGRGCGAYQLGTVDISSVRTSSVRKNAVGVGTISTSAVRTSTVRTSTVGISTVGTSNVGTSNVSTQQFDLMAPISPAAPGGLGPHPAREPEPV